MTTKDLDDKLLKVFNDCPYNGKREDCTFPEMQEMEIDDRLDFLDKIDEKKAKARGVADYIEKPLDMRDYAMKIRKVLDVE